MASKTVKLRLPDISGRSGLTLLLLAQGATSISNGSGDTLTAGSYGVFTATVTEAITGWFDVIVMDGSNTVAVGGLLYIERDVEGTYYVDDPSIVQAKTNLIGTGSATLVVPVSSQGKIAQIFRGDDYLSANGRAFQWTITEPTNFTAATATCTFGGSDGTNTWSVPGTITDQGSTWLLSFDMTKTDTDIPAGNYDWTVEVKSSTGVEHTVSFGGDTRVRKKYT